MSWFVRIVQITMIYDQVNEDGMFISVLKNDNTSKRVTGRQPE